MNWRKWHRVISVIVSLIVAVVAITVPLKSVHITPTGMVSIGTSVAYASPGVPVTVYDGTTTDLTAYETGTRVFKNPRGLGYSYVFYFDSDSYVKYAYSSDGSSWTSGNAASAAALYGNHWDIDIVDDGSQLIVYMIRAGATSTAKQIYRRGVIADSGYTITWGSESSFGGWSKPAENIVVKVDTGGYVWWAWHKTGTEGDIAVSSISLPGDAPSFSRVAYEVTTTTTYPTIVPTGSQAVDLIWQFGTTRLSAAGFTAGPTKGTQYDLTKTLTNYHLSAVRSGSTTHVLYTDSNNLKQNTFVAGTGWGTETTVKATTTIDSMSLGLDETSTPDKLYAFYQYGTLGDVYYKTSPVDTISWGTEQSIDDDTEDIDYLSASYKDWGADSKIQLVYTTQTSYLLRFAEVPPSWESYKELAHTTVWGTLANPYDGTTQTVFMYGEGFLASQLYHVGFYDPSVPPNKVATVSSNSTATGNLSVQYVLTTDPAAEAGTWHAVVYEDPTSPAENYTAGDPSAVIEDDFEVTAEAIPEFPTVIAGIVVAGLCFGIYYWMRKRRLAYVRVKA